MWLSSWLLLVLVSLGLFYRGYTYSFWLTALGLAILVMAIKVPLVLTLCVCVPWLFILLLCGVPPIRRVIITRPFFRFVHRNQSSLSAVEKELLHSGGVWWEEELFTGVPDWKKLYALPHRGLSPEESQFLKKEVNELCHLIDDWACLRDGHLSAAAWQYIKEKGFWGLEIPKEYGGHGFSTEAHSAIVANIASCSVSAAIMVMVPNSLGPASFIHCFGTQDQKDRYLPRLADGQDIGCFALTSLEAGSDATHFADQGVVCQGEWGGEQVLGIRFSFEKRYITLAPVATLMAVAIQLSDPDHLLGEQDRVGITVVLVKNTLPGVAQGERHAPLHQHFYNGPVSGEDVFVPITEVVGARAGCGRGWFMMMDYLAVGRGISLPSLSAALSQLSVHATTAYANIRYQFRRPIADFEGVALHMADMGGHAHMCEALRYFTVQAVEAGVKPSIASAIAKYHATEFARRVVTQAVDIHGGRAVQLGPRNYLGQPYCALPILSTVEGANIMTRHLIIYGQGVVRSHPVLSQMMALIDQENGKTQLKAFDCLFVGQVGVFMRHIVQGIVDRVTHLRLLRVPVSNPFTSYIRSLTHLSRVFVLCSDVSLLVFGARMKVQEGLSACLADALSYLYIASAVLKHHQEMGKEEDEIYVRWSLDRSLHCIEQALESWFDQFPKRWLARSMRAAFMLSQYKGPSHKQSLALAKQMRENREQRARLAPWCVVEGQPCETVLSAEAQWLSVLPQYKTLQRAVAEKKIPHQGDMQDTISRAVSLSIMTKAEAEQLMTAYQAVQEALGVDSFTDLFDDKEVQYARQREEAQL